MDKPMSDRPPELIEAWNAYTSRRVVELAVASPQLELFLAFEAGWLAALRGQGEWRTIDSAPKDGKTILISGGVVMYDLDAHTGWDPFAGVTTAWWNGDGWCSGYGAEYDGQYWHKPTDWMPLPEPPVLIREQPAETEEEGE